jgi:hypothetical protein
MNPLGVRALYLGSSAYRIHGTDAPWTIGQPVSKGCIRMYNQDVIDLYDRVKLGAKVTATWDSYLDGTRRVVAHAQGGGTIRTDSVRASGRSPVGYASYYSPQSHNAPAYNTQAGERPIGKRRGARPVATTAQERASQERDVNARRAAAGQSAARSRAAFASDDERRPAASDRSRSRGKDVSREKASEGAKAGKSTAASRRKKQPDHKEPASAGEKAEHQEQRAHVDIGPLGALFR